ncbi:unnamed protein product [Pocillopora meandrina]|uniref:Phosphatidylserine decarboxylase proenzyme, mitochondrial n=1 Tax=Pocillopora meandrina TaxID=46732 RepID=A0AAU9XLL7_9CNID|nr:unnamed protein product [Pocillopora meandrina]
MRVHADDDLSFSGYRQLNDLRHDSAWITSCVLYAHSAICLVVVVAFASYGIVWPVKENSDTLLHKTTRRGARRLGTAVRNYMRTLRWFSIPASVGFAYVCYQQFWHIREREKRKLHAGESLEPSQWQVALFKKLPTRACSRALGAVCDIDLPPWLRKPIIGSYSWYFACNVTEAVEEEIVNYSSLGAFFRRQLKPDARRICDASCIVSPADGTVLHFGEVQNDLVEQVKGITYSMKTFLGPNQPSASTYTRTRLYHCVIYLGPGDYHSFHSPSEWNVKQRRHFPGDLFSVHPGVARMVAGLFNHNERVVLTGTWKHGFFSFTAVGAYNVGSINLKFDQDLKTNCPGRYSEGSFDECDYISDEPSGVSLVRGERMGAFNLGSTIVLIFEAPTDFIFDVQPGQKLKYGEPVGSSREDTD